MNDIDPKSLLSSPSWIAMAGASVGTFFAKLIIGRYLKSLDELKHLVNDMKEEITVIREDVRELKGRFMERDHKRGTWPGDRR